MSAFSRPSPRDAAPITLPRLLERVHDAERETFLEHHRRLARDGGSFSVTFRLAGPENTRWLHAIGDVTHTPSGRPLMSGAVMDVTELKRAEAAIAAAHETVRHLVDAAPFGIIVVNADLQIDVASAGARQVFDQVTSLEGASLAAVLQSAWLEPFASQALTAFNTAIANEAPRQRSTVELRKDRGVVEAYDWRLEPLRLADGRKGVVCYFYDLTERENREAQIRTLMEELTHRTKNLLSVIQAIARMSLSGAPRAVAEDFGRRLAALGATNDLLLAAPGGADLHDILSAQTQHLVASGTERLKVHGPKIKIATTHSQLLGVALYELATNAAKYGALSSEKGTIHVAWATATEGGNAMFTMVWREQGGPAVRHASRRGFGSRILTEIPPNALKGETRFDFVETGIVWTLSCRLETLVGEP